uniref:Uncharacterized protein n=1 Tax=Tetranychus urticae TaxID=32264 RepID=T1K6N8_TETUR
MLNNTIGNIPAPYEKQVYDHKMGGIMQLSVLEFIIFLTPAILK